MDIGSCNELILCILLRLIMSLSGLYIMRPWFLSSELRSFLQTLLDLLQRAEDYIRDKVDLTFFTQTLPQLVEHIYSTAFTAKERERREIPQETGTTHAAHYCTLSSPLILSILLITYIHLIPYLHTPYYSTSQYCKPLHPCYPHNPIPPQNHVQKTQSYPHSLPLLVSIGSNAIY